MMCFIGGFSSCASVSSKEILRDCHRDDNALLLLLLLASNIIVDLAVLCWLWCLLCYYAILPH